MWCRATGTLKVTDTHEEVQWLDGVITGTPAGVAEFHATQRSLALDGPICMEGGGPCSFENHIKSPWATVVTFEQMFRNPTLTVWASEDFPSRDPLPPGAIG
jgi:hypothetical protein